MSRRATGPSCAFAAARLLQQCTPRALQGLRIVQVHPETVTDVEGLCLTVGGQPAHRIGHAAVRCRQSVEHRRGAKKGAGIPAIGILQLLADGDDALTVQLDARDIGGIDQWIVKPTIDRKQQPVLGRAGAHQDAQQLGIE